mmetsp:Transcript_21510/g.26451  ORF Transcript_21510/g.26451 Transcript_21510/m.26451 type:complete len:206 (-) Transcript_21510:1640-2257(-)
MSVVHGLVCVPMQRLQANKFDFHGGEFSRKFLELLVLLRELHSELVGFHIECGRLQFRFNQLLLDGAVVHIQLVQLLLQLLVFSLRVSELALQLFHFSTARSRLHRSLPDWTPSPVLILGQEAFKLSHFAREHLVLDCQRSDLALTNFARSSLRMRLLCLCSLELLKQLAVFLLQQRHCLHVLVFHRSNLRVHLRHLLMQHQYFL